MYKLYFSQRFPIDIQQAWDFFSYPLNLEKITPKSLALKIDSEHMDKKMYPGQIITYSVKPLWNISMEWVTQIAAVQEPTYFIDEQKFGPYTFWHHEHWFTPIPQGILVEDVIYYKLPWGIIGKALHYLKIRNELKKIFLHRNEVLEKLLGSYPSEAK